MSKGTMKQSLRFLSSLMALLSLLLLLSTSNAVTAQENKDYTRYSKYHPYCSTPEQMKQRAIPPLQYSGSSSTPQIIHVTALIRHGARTPYAGYPTYNCWSDYWTNPLTGIWNCDLKTYMAPPSTDKSTIVVNSEGIIEEEPDFLFEKQYDALMFSHINRTGNELNGTCQMGQLLMRGYEQELQNG